MSSQQEPGKAADEPGVPDVEVVSMEVTSETHMVFDYYSCEEAIKRLNDYLDHELSPEERQDVVKHLTICKPCLERFHFEENLVVSLRQKVAERICPNGLRDRLSKIIKKAHVILFFF
jgi:anti-sigma factor (TIGR02949 family)